MTTQLNASRAGSDVFRWALVFVLAVALAGCKPSGREELRIKSDEQYLKLVGKPSPPLKFKALDGREVDLDQLKGKVVLLDFWATWCPPCLEEIPNVRSAYERYQKEGFEIVGVSFDVDRQRLEEIVKREQMPWPQYFDGGGRDAAPGKTFGIQHWPTMWLLDRNGVIRFISAGAGLDRKISLLLKETANPVNAARGVFEKKAALDRSGDEPAKPGGPILPPGAPQDPAYLHWLGKPFPPFKATAIDGRSVDTDKLRGRILLIDFWATWCPACMEQVPNVKAAYARYHPQGLELIGISADESRADLERVMRAQSLTWPQIHEGREGDRPLHRRYGVDHYPSIWLVDRQGIIRDVTGVVALDQKIAKLLAETSASAPVANPPADTAALPRTNATASATNAPPPPPAPPAPPRAPEVKLGDHSVSVKNITIGAKRSTALLQIGPATYTVWPGLELVFPAGGAQRKATCAAVERSAVVLTVEGQAEPLRLSLP